MILAYLEKPLFCTRAFFLAFLGFFGNCILVCVKIKQIMQKYTAIILTSRDANEFDRIYTMYTLEQGLARAVAKGVRKSAAKLAGHLEPATLSEVYIARARGIGQITGAITLDDFSGVKNNFEKLREILKIFRFFSKNFAEGEKDKRIFELLSGFSSIAGKAEIVDISAEAFWWKLFDVLGQRPEVMKCASCRKKLIENTKKFFSAERGGVICAGCDPRFQGLAAISDNQIKLLRIFLGNPLSKIAKVKVRRGELKGLEKMRENFEKYNF